MFLAGRTVARHTVRRRRDREAFKAAEEHNIVADSDSFRFVESAANERDVSGYTYLSGSAVVSLDSPGRPAGRPRAKSAAAAATSGSIG
jgi:hypothetical protein